MKKKIFLLLGILTLLLVTPFRVVAQSFYADEQPQQISTVEVNGNSAIVPFSELGYREKTLVSPYGVTSIFFNTPLSWKLVPKAEVELNYDVLLSGADLAKVANAENPYGGTLLFTLNGKIVGSAPLGGNGSHTVRIEFPEESLVSALDDGRHQLSVALDAQFSCNYDINARVVIKPTSSLHLTFEESSPELNLSHLPAPFHRDNSFIPENNLVVIPDEPDALELQAALDVMAGFGSMIGSDSNMQMVSMKEWAALDRSLYNMIFVGTPGHMQALSEVSFQVAVAGGKYSNLPEKSVNDGVVQLAVSPWNPNRVVMMVGGNTGEAVVKAAQAVSSGKILIYENPALAFVSNVQLLSESLPTVEDFNFESLGYVTETLSGVGVKSQEYLFYAGKEQILTDEGHIDLIYYHSGLLDYGVSSFAVELNGQVIASKPFSEESEQVTTLQIKIPPGTLRYGENRLTISASMLFLSSCDASGFSDPWFTISNQSSMHLPIVSGTDLAEPLLKDLKFFPELFVTHSDLGDVAFVFAKADLNSWKTAGALAYNLGKQFNPLISNLYAAYADNVPPALHDEKSLVVMGLASEMPFVADINDALPAPFDLTTNVASERQMQVVYRIPDGVSVGYLELMMSPYNAERSILVVSGNSHDGVAMAGSSLLVDQLSSQLAGVFAVTNGKQVATGNASSPFSIVDNVVPGAVSVNTTPVADILGGTPEVDRPGWLMPMLVVSFATVVGVLGYVAVTAIAKRRSQRKAEKAEPEPEKKK